MCCQKFAARWTKMFVKFIVLISCVVISLADVNPSVNDIWSPNHHLDPDHPSTADNDLIAKLQILRKYIEIGKLSRQANFEHLAKHFFTFLIDTESNVSSKSKLTPDEFEKKLEDFRYVTKNDKDEDEDEVNPAEVDKFTET